MHLVLETNSDQVLMSQVHMTLLPLLSHAVRCGTSMSVTIHICSRALFWPCQELLGICWEHVGTLYPLVSCVWHGASNVSHYICSRALFWPCQEHVRNPIPIGVMCMAWDINVSHYICSTQLCLALFLAPSPCLVHWLLGC